MRKILIADDNPHAQRMGTQILSQAGHKAFTLSHGDQVHSFISEHRPDLAILDLRMPGIAGTELCRRIKSDAELKSTKILLLAGPLDQIDTADVEGAGSDGVIQKPLDAHTLLTMIDDLLADSPAGSESGNPETPQVRSSAVPQPAEEKGLGDKDSEAPTVFGRNPATAESAPHRNGSATQPVDPTGISTPREQGKEASIPPSGALAWADSGERKSPERELSIAGAEIMDELSDVAFGSLAPAIPKLRTRDDSLRTQAGTARANGSNGQNGKSQDAFAALVEHALGADRRDEEFEARVLQIVDDALQGAMLTIRDRITHEIVTTYRSVAV